MSYSLTGSQIGSSIISRSTIRESEWNFKKMPSIGQLIPNPAGRSGVARRLQAICRKSRSQLGERLARYIRRAVPTRPPAAYRAECRGAGVARGARCTRSGCRPSRSGQALRAIYCATSAQRIARRAVCRLTMINMSYSLTGKNIDDIVFSLCEPSLQRDIAQPPYPVVPQPGKQAVA